MRTAMTASAISTGSAYVEHQASRDIPAHWGDQPGDAWPIRSGPSRAGVLVLRLERGFANLLVEIEGEKGVRPVRGEPRYVPRGADRD